MPSLYICGRPTLIAGDDVRCCVVWYYLLRLLQISCSLPLIVFSLVEKTEGENHDEVCPEQDNDPFLNENFGLFYSYLWLSFVYTLSMAAVESSVWVVSGMGTPTRNKRRSKLMRRLIYLKFLAVFVIRLGLTIYGVFLWNSLEDYCQCGPNAEIKSPCQSYGVWTALFRILVISQLSECFANVLVLVYFVWLRFGHLRSHVLSGICCSRQACIKWFVCCCCSCATLLTCWCTRGGEAVLHGDFTTLALLLDDYLGGHVDVVLSDVLMAFRVLRRVQLERRLECQEALVSHTSDEEEDTDAVALEEGSTTSREQHHDEESQDVELAEQGGPGVQFSCRPVLDRIQGHLASHMVTRRLLSKKSRDDVFAVAEGVRYMRLSLAIYSYIMQMIHNPCTECCCVLSPGTMRHFATCRCLRPDDRIVADNLCGWNKASVRHRGVLDDADIVYAQFQVGVARTPYCIVLDHVWRSVVVVIRGTLSLDDLMADLMVQPASLEEMGKRCGFDGSQSFAHKGVVDCAVWVYEQIERHGKLDELLLKEDARYKDYRLRVVGHSLGAGCASLVALFLRRKFPSLRCLCFCPPGATVSADLAEECKEYLTSYVLDSDIVPRLSLQALENLRDDVLKMVARIRVSKYKAMKRVSVNVSRTVLAENNREVLYPSDDIPESNYKERLATFQDDQQSRRQTSRIKDVPLWPPGKIVHLVHTGQKVEESICRTAGSTLMCGMMKLPQEQSYYKPLWADVADFQEIVLNSHFLDDHDPENVLRELERTATSFGLSAPYRLPQGES